MKPYGATILDLMRETGSDRVAIERWLLMDGISPVRTKQEQGRVRKWWPRDLSIACIQSHKSRSVHRNGEANIDPETGLTWHQRKDREDALSKARDNEVADKLKNEEWVSAEFMHNKFASFCLALEQIPGKLKSEIGLTDKQALAVRRAIDEARESAAKEVEKEEE